MYNTPRSYVQYAEIICAIRRDHMCNTLRSYVPSAEIACAFRLQHVLGDLLEREPLVLRYPVPRDGLLRVEDEGGEVVGALC